MDTRVCKKCSVEKPLEEFRKHARHLGGRRTVCKACEYGHEPYKKPTEEKICTLCEQMKPVSAFRFVDKKRGFRASRCNECDKVYNQKRLAEQTERAYRWKYIKEKTTEVQKVYSKMLKKQDYKCRICGISTEELDKNLCVDHCHTTEKIRGLLCSNCNSVLGFSKDNIDVLKSAIKYLRQTSRK